MDSLLHRMPGKSRDRNGLISPLRDFLARGARLAELLVFPSTCRRCGRLLENPGERVLCRRCLEALAPCGDPFCLVCGRFFSGAGEPHACAACLVRPPAFSVHRSAARYEGALKDALLLFKYRGYRPLGKPLAVLMHAAYGRDPLLWEGASLLVPVPLHRRRKRRRGFNQAAVLALELGRLTGLPAAPRALRRMADIPPQTTLGRNDRRENVRGAFQAGKENAVRGRVAVLVDDVFTTGSTLSECARVLRSAGASEVRAVTIAQA